MVKFLTKIIILLICCITTLPAATSANGRSKKCIGATPCLACKSKEDCNSCKYCKTSKKCGTCKSEVQSVGELNLLRNTICDGVIIYGPGGKAILPLPATMDRTINSLAKAGLAFRNNSAMDTSGTNMREHYRFIFTNEHITGIISDTSFSDVETAAHYVDSITKELRKSIQSKEDIMVTLGLGGHRIYYLPPIICGFRAIGHVFTLAPNMIDKTAMLIHEIKMVALPEK